MPGGNPFEDMSHERMLQWLDQANSGTVQAAADRLAKAAEEIHKIAEELKIRPQWVEWKGEGANAFRTWTADLANSTIRLGDFSESSAKWLAQASSAIARAQATIPRDTKAAEANSVAATSAPNDPDADAVSTKSAAELAALAESKEKVRQEAAAEMIKLGQAYEFSAVQLNALERPKFPPPPDAVLPDDSSYESVDLQRPGNSAQGIPSRGDVDFQGAGRNRAIASDASDLRPPLDGASSQRVVHMEEEPPTRMGLDSVETLLPDKQTPTGPVSGPSDAGRAEGNRTSPHTGWMPPVPGRDGATSGGPPAHRRSVTGRMPQMPGQSVPSTNPVRSSGGTGIIGGRSVTPPSVGQPRVIHRGTVVGAPSPTGRPPMGTAMGPTAPVGRAVSQPGQAPPGRLPSPNGGAMGNSPQRTGRAVPGHAASDGAAETAATSSGRTRSGVVGGVPVPERPGESRSIGAPQGSRSTFSRNVGTRSVRPIRSPQDEDSARRSNGRTVPPVID